MSYKDFLRQAIAEAMANPQPAPPPPDPFAGISYDPNQRGVSYSSMPWDTVADGNSQYTDSFTYVPLDQYVRENGAAPPTMEEYQQSIAMGYGDASNLPYVPTIVTSPTGEQFVRFAANKDEGGLGAFINEAIGPALAAAAIGMGGADILGQLGGASNIGGGLDVGLGSDAPWGANPSSLGDLFAETPINAGNLTAPAGEFTASQLPGGALNPMVDLGGAGGVLGAGATTGGLSLPNLPSMPPATPELPTNNATPGAVTPATGTTNPVTAGAPGTSGAVTAATTGLTSANLLDRILNGTATAGDWAQVLGTVGSTALGVYGSNQQADALRDIANQSRADRQPFLDKSLQWLNDPASYTAGPGRAGLDAALRGLSVQGNPFGSGTSLALAGDVANRNWQNAVTGFGNLGLSGSDSRNNLLASGAAADRGVTASLASGLGTITQPDNSLEGILRRMQSSGYSGFVLP